MAQEEAPIKVAGVLQLQQILVEEQEAQNRGDSSRLAALAYQSRIRQRIADATNGKGEESAPAVGRFLRENQPVIPRRPPPPTDWASEPTGIVLLDYYDEDGNGPGSDG